MLSACSDGSHGVKPDAAAGAGGSGGIVGTDGIADTGGGADEADAASSPDAAGDASDRGDTPDAAAPDAEGGSQDGSTVPIDAGCGLSTISVARLPPISFTAYHTQQQISDYLQAAATALPDVVQFHVLGQSIQGRYLPYLAINATCLSKPPAIFLNGTHHGDEPSSTESVLALPDYLLRTSQTDSNVKNLIGEYAFYILPIVNPDGLAASTRTNAAGCDLNRDYSYPGRSDADSFKCPETQLIKSLQDALVFHSALAFHSGAQEVVWPWCYTADATADDSFFTSAGKLAAQAMSFTVYQQSYDDYPTQGEYIDYAYWKNETLAATFEVSNDKTPSTSALATVVANAWKGTRAWLQATAGHDAGTLAAEHRGVRLRFPRATPVDGKNRLE